MRGAAGVCVALVLGALLAATSMQRLQAADFGSREEAVAMVHRVQEKFKKDGPEATFKAINDMAPGFIDRDLFPYVHKIDGTELVAIGPIPAIRGKNLHDMKDQDGKFTTQGFMKIATTPPYQGWSDYRFLNPKTKTVEEKSAWIERMGDYLVGVGIYRDEQPNKNVIGLISGSPNSDDTYLQIAYDLAEVLNDSDNLRILPIAGIGGPSNIRDVRNVRGVDIGLTQTNILNGFRRSNERLGHFDDKIVYIAKLFNEEIHLVARSNITSITQLKGLKVNLDARASGTSHTMRDLFNTLGIDVQEVNMSQVEAIEKVKRGEIAATALIAGKPVRSMSNLSGADGLHLVPIAYPKPLYDDYLPTTFSHDDYPALVPAGQSVDSVAVSAVLFAYNWPKTNLDRYSRVQRFVEAFFPKIAEFQKPPHHVKWREVNVAATLPGWKRFDAAQAWLDQHNNSPDTNSDQSAAGQATELRQAATSTGLRPAAGAEQPLPPRDSALYQEFLKWKQVRGR
jgi:TRAP-type uncharacterized transport system substrate-binding protein